MFTPPLWKLEKSSFPPSESVRMLIQLLWTKTRHGAPAVEYGQALMILETS